MNEKQSKMMDMIIKVVTVMGLSVYFSGFIQQTIDVVLFTVIIGVIAFLLFFTGITKKIGRFE